jgi:hypothetical protein
MVNSFLNVFNRMCLKHITPISENLDVPATFFVSNVGAKSYYILMPYHWHNIHLVSPDLNGLLMSLIVHFSKTIYMITLLRPLHDDTYKSMDKRRHNILMILKSQEFIDAVAIETIFPTVD